MAKTTGCIYEIKNTVNNKSYIGQTTNVTERWKFHLRGFTMYPQLPLYQDMKKFGITAFTFQILETNIPKDKLTTQEIFWINKKNSINAGYNQAHGTDSITKKLTLSDVKAIQKALRENIPIQQIAEEFNIGTSSISDINCGDTWYDENIEYPIRQTNTKRKNFSETDIQNIYNMLRNQAKLKEIATKYKTSIQTISKINKGLIYQHSTETYPICDKQTASSHLKTNDVKQIAYLLCNTHMNYTQISRQFHVDRHTIAKINNGERYTKCLYEIGYTSFPLRKISTNC